MALRATKVDEIWGIGLDTAKRLQAKRLGRCLLADELFLSFGPGAHRPQSRPPEPNRGAIWDCLRISRTRPAPDRSQSKREIRWLSQG
jgi:hypothetical protein